MELWGAAELNDALDCVKENVQQLMAARTRNLRRRSCRRRRLRSRTWSQAVGEKVFQWVGFRCLGAMVDGGARVGVGTLGVVGCAQAERNVEGEQKP